MGNYLLTCQCDLPLSCFGKSSAQGIPCSLAAWISPIQEHVDRGRCGLYAEAEPAGVKGRACWPHSCSAPSLEPGAPEGSEPGKRSPCHQGWLREAGFPQLLPSHWSPDGPVEVTSREPVLFMLILDPSSFWATKMSSSPRKWRVVRQPLKDTASFTVPPLDGPGHFRKTPSKHLSPAGQE